MNVSRIGSLFLVLTTLAVLSAWMSSGGGQLHFTSYDRAAAGFRDHAPIWKGISQFSTAADINAQQQKTSETSNTTTGFSSISAHSPCGTGGSTRLYLKRVADLDA